MRGKVHLIGLSLRVHALAICAAILAACSPQTPPSGQLLVLELGDPAQLSPTVDILKKRIAAAGDRYTSVEPRSDGRIEVRAPGDYDLRGMAAYLTRPGVLSLNLVDGAADPSAYQIGVESNGRIELTSADTGGQPLVIFADPIVITSDIAKADQVQDETGRPAIAVALHPSGAKRFGAATSTHVGGLMAIVLDGRLVSSPMIQTPIMGGEVRITGGFTTQEAEQLARIFSAGALPTRLTLVETSTFGSAPP